MSVPKPIDGYKRKSVSNGNESMNVIPSSFKGSYVDNHSQVNEDFFKTGDFSAKYLKRGSVFEKRVPSIPDDEGEDSSTKGNTVVVQGGFQEINTGILPKDEGFNSTIGRKSHSHSISEIDNPKDVAMNYNADFQVEPDQAPSDGNVPEIQTTTYQNDANVNQPEHNDGSTAENTVNNNENKLDFNIENPDPKIVDVVERHLVNTQPSKTPSIFSNERVSTHNAPGEEDFDSLQLQGGDVTRELYNWTKSQRAQSPLKRSSSFHDSRSSSFVGSRVDALLDNNPSVNDLRMPGGFRRSFIHQKRVKRSRNPNIKQNFFTSNFIEFLALYGHFAGEDIDDDDDEDDDENDDENDNENSPVFDDADEESRLLPYDHNPRGRASVLTTVIFLFKAFIGTGVLFLPRGFYNGGLGLSSVLLICFCMLSYYCFAILIDARLTTNQASYSDIGGFVYGKPFKHCIAGSIILSQIGFTAAYTIFVATNLQGLVDNIFKKFISIEFFIFIQLIIYVPLSVIRKLETLDVAALMGSILIVIGILFVYYFSCSTLLTSGVADFKYINKNNWKLFIGTAIFTNEAIGLLLPIQGSMKKPHLFKPILFFVMITISVIFVSVGSLCYLAYGSDVKTVVLLNFPKNSLTVNLVQLLYAIAILCSTPLQLFPAVKMLEQYAFKRSGKYDPSIKWAKNYFRVTIVFLTVLISWGGSNNLDKFVSLIGSFTCIPLIYIFPPMLHLKVCELSVFKRTLNWCILVSGILMMVYTSADTLIHWVE